MPRALLNFDHYDGGWKVHFIEQDCRTSISTPTRYIRFETLEELRAFVLRCNIEDIAVFEMSVRAWGRGSNYVQLTDEQYARIKGR